MTVWVLTGEYALSENGETFWIEGVYKTRRAAAVAVDLQANSDDFKERKCLGISGEQLGNGWTEEERDDEDGADWEVSWTAHEWEVTG